MTIYQMEDDVALESEDDVKRALEIDSWRNLSRDKVMKFAAMMPNMNHEVALGLIGKFPAFSTFALGTLDSLEKASRSSHASNDASQERVHDAYREARDILKGELDRDDLSPEDRRFLVESVLKTVDKELEKDSENKRFLDGIFNKRAALAAGAIAAGLVFVGGKIALEREEGGKSLEQ
jgi:hypothetical protein